MPTREGKQVWPANYNQTGQLVVAGIKEDLQAMESVFKEAGAKRALLLNMSIASHCPLLEVQWNRWVKRWKRW
jgi:[acyl-carrier-protein] S-malonyltransferase